MVSGYDLINLGNDLYTSEVGNPSLPEMNYNILLPPTAEVTKVEVISYKVKDIPGSFNIFPVQPPVPISQIHEGMELVLPNPLIYNSNQAYPGKLSDFTPTGCMSGYRLAGISIYPLQYIPKDRHLRLYTEITLRIDYEEGRHEMISLSRGQVEFFGTDVKNLVINPEDVIRWAPGVKALFRDSTDYLIITGPSYVSAFQPIANWRTKKGYYVKILPTDSISNYPGRDNPERLRNLIINYWQNKGTKWVLLAGDISVVPFRTCRVVCAGYTGDIPCDLYFADLQYSWDGNRNNIFGEFPGNGDTVDLYYDLHIGRVSIDNTTQSATFVMKDTIYEKRPAANYMVRMFLPQGTLWTAWPGDSTQNILARYPPTPPWVIRKMYETQNQLSNTACTETLRTGVGFCHLVGHGNAGGIYAKSSTIGCYSSSSNVYGLTNTNKYIIANSIACDAGAFDQGSTNGDCYSENFVNAPNGGAVGAILNSRYGWGAGSTGPAYSEKFDLRFYENFFALDTLNFEIGKVNSLSKQAFRNNAYTTDVWRWCYYELNLLGDPALPMWASTPLTLTVTHPNSINTGPQNYTVTVRSSGNPLGNATVCLWKGNEVYTVGKTNSSGSVTLAINPATTGQLFVTVSAKNHLPYESSAMVAISDNRIASPGVRIIKIGVNPVRGQILIRYSLSNPERIKIKLYDAVGRNLTTIANGRFDGVGQITWEIINLANGIYFLCFETKVNSWTKCIVVMK